MGEWSYNPNDLYSLVHGAEFIVIDFETTGLHQLKDEPVSFSVLTNKGVAFFPIAPYRSIDSAVTQPGLDRDVAGRILREETGGIPYLGHNLKFDAHYLYKIAGFYPRHTIDTQVGYWLLHEEGELGLKAIATRLLQKQLPDYKDIEAQASELIKSEILAHREQYVNEQKLVGRKKTDARKEVSDLFPLRNATIFDIPIEWIAPYCVKDVLLTYWLWVAYVRPGLEAEGLLDYFYSVEMPFAKALWGMEQRGFQIDSNRLLQVEKELTVQSIDLENQFLSTVGRDVNLRSNQQLQELFFNEMGLEPIGKETKGGNPSLDEKALLQLHIEYGKKTPVFDILLQYRQLRKIIGTYTSSLVDLAYNGRVYTRFRHCGTVTGRLSSESPNCQNLVKQIKTAFVAPPGKLILEADYSQAELRVLADRTQDDLLLDAYRHGKDIHTQTMEKLGLTDRRLAKVCNFGGSIIWFISKKKRSCVSSAVKSSLR